MEIKIFGSKGRVANLVDRVHVLDRTYGVLLQSDIYYFFITRWNFKKECDRNYYAATK